MTGCLAHREYRCDASVEPGEPFAPLVARRRHELRRDQRPEFGPALGVVLGRRQVGVEAEAGEAGDPHLVDGGAEEGVLVALREVAVRVGEGVARDLRMQLMDKYLHLPGARFDSEPVPSLLRHFSAPVRLDDIVLAEMLWAAFKALFTVTAILGVMLALGISHSPKLLLAWPVLLGVGITFSCIALIFNALAKGYDFFTYYFTLVLTPMMFLSGIFFPLDQLPVAVRVVADWLPLSNAVAPPPELWNGEDDAECALA